MGKDDLDWGEVFGVGDGVIQNADASDDLFGLLNSVVQSAFDSIGWVTDDSLALGDALRAFNSANFAIFKEDFIDVSVQHEGSSINSADSWEAFRNASQTEDGVDEGWRVFAHGIHVELDLSDQFDSWTVQKAVIGVQSNCMSNEIDCVFFQPVFVKHFLSRSIDLDSIVGFGFTLFEILDSFQEFLASSLLEKSHEVWGESFLGGDGNFENFHASLGEESGFLELEDVGAIDS